MVELLAMSGQRAIQPRRISPFEMSERQSRLDEDLICLELGNRWGLRCERFAAPKREGRKTPDFKVLKDGELIAYLEVKTSHDSMKFAERADGLCVSTTPNNPIFSRLANDIYRADEQFTSVNPDTLLPNILAFVNHDEKAGAIDLRAVVTGSVPLEGGGSLPAWHHISEGRIRDAKKRIHLYIWCDHHPQVDAIKEHHEGFDIVIPRPASRNVRVLTRWNQMSDPDVMAQLCRAFGVNPVSINS
jgi:hypothetical protein